MRLKAISIHVLQALLEGALITALVIGLVAGTAFAARGGGGGGGGNHGKPGSGTGTATVSVSPNPVPSYSEFQATGCGYAPNVGVQFTLYAPGVTAVYGGIVDGNGCLYNAVLWANAPGSATLNVMASSGTRLASVTFTIQ
jgi:hypothetical protein